MARQHPSQEAPAPSPTPCPQCGGERFLAEGVNSVRLVKPGTALPGITGGFTELWALVCSVCGYTTFYTKNPSKIKE